MNESQELLDFIAASPTPFHAVARAVQMLEGAGFSSLAEGDAWSLAASDRRYVTRNGSSLAAFIVGREPAAETGFGLIGAHTDSPNLRLKPTPEIENRGYLQLGVEVYGGALLASWTDRDLGLAGRVMIEGERGEVESRLVLIDRPIARIPQLAIHLDREVNEKGLQLNRETHLPPVIGLSSSGAGEFSSWLGESLGVDAARIWSHELMLFDLNPPTFSGIHQEFLNAPRLDNLASCHAALTALVAAAESARPATRAIVLYDNEEIGSSTRQGAAGPFLGDVLRRIVLAMGGDREAEYRARARSFVISADMAHAVHPNYPEKHESRHSPRLNGGPILKINANARYATDAESSAFFQRLCREVEVPVQKFVMRADMACGSTIGPLVATRLGLKTVDVGSAALSMHSCREMAGARDHALMIRALRGFLEVPHLPGRN